MEETQSEGMKFDNSKTPLELLPPDALWSIADVLKFGAQKYDVWNWYKGIRYSRMFGACLRHLWQWWRGEALDPESGLPHLSHAGCCLLFLLQHVLERRVERDDRPEWNKKSYLLGDNKCIKSQSISATPATVDSNCGTMKQSDAHTVLLSKCNSSPTVKRS